MGAAVFLIEPRPLPTPADAERLVADLWQLSAGRRLGLFLLGMGGRAMLGVTSSHRGIEETAAATISQQCGGAVEPGWAVGQMLDTATEVRAVNLVPTDRHLALGSATFGWQRTDPLRGTFLALIATAPTALVGVALSLRPLPDLGFALSLGGFAAGPSAAGELARLTASLGGVGVRLRSPVLQRRAAHRMLAAVLRRPASVHRAEVVALFWHPPYGAGRFGGRHTAGGGRSRTALCRRSSLTLRADTHRVTRPASRRAGVRGPDGCRGDRCEG